MRVTEIATTLAGSALALVDPRNLDETTRRPYQVASAVVTAMSFKTSNFELNAQRPLIRWGATATAAGVGFWATSGRFDHWDTRFHKWLESCGVRHPRRWMAGGTAALYIGSFALNRWSQKWAQQAEWERIMGNELDGDTELLAPVSSEVRELVELLLPPDYPDAAALRAQLSNAHVVDRGQEGAEAYFIIDHDHARVVPHQQRWPLSGSFTRDGVEYRLVLEIDDGQLSALTAVPNEDGLSEDELEELLSEELSWPAPSEVRVLSESR